MKSLYRGGHNRRAQSKAGLCVWGAALLGCPVDNLNKHRSPVCYCSNKGRTDPHLHPLGTLLAQAKMESFQSSQCLSDHTWNIISGSGPHNSRKSQTEKERAKKGHKNDQM